MLLRRFQLSAFLVLASFATGAWAGDRACISALEQDGLTLSAAEFAAIFHDVKAEATVTSLRLELKGAFDARRARDFVRLVLDRMGERASVRDVPSDPSLEYVTNTDILRPFKGIDPEWDETVYSGLVRIRDYYVVPKGTPVATLRGATGLVRSRIVDAPGAFAKLEFKVGHPNEPGPDGELSQMDGVVDKPGVVLDRADIDRLFASPGSFARFRDEILDRGRSLTSVNSQAELETMIERIGRLHEALPSRLQPWMNVRYRREAYRLRFPNPEGGRDIEAQLTIDRDIEVTLLEDGTRYAYPPDEIVVELKIPVKYATMSDRELERLGLGELAEIRSRYQRMQPAPGTDKGVGKRARGTLEIRMQRIAR
jgi:hypothetical protein